MKNKLFLIVFSVVMAASFCTLAGCSDEVQDVSVQYNSPASVSGLTGKLVDSDNYFVLTWNSVDNAGGYTVYYQEQGKKTIVRHYSIGQGEEGEVFDPAGPGFVDGTAADTNKVQAYMSTNNASGKTYRFGVTASPAFSNNNTDDSGVVWTDYFTF